jgi:hypothetical protein
VDAEVTDDPLADRHRRRDLLPRLLQRREARAQALLQRLVGGPASAVQLFTQGGELLFVGLQAGDFLGGPRGRSCQRATTRKLSIVRVLLKMPARE